MEHVINTKSDTSAAGAAPSPWPYAWLYGLFFSSWGILLPYFYLHLVDIGNSKRYVALIATAFPLMTIFATPLWGYWIDRRLNRRLTMMGLMAAAGSVFCLFLHYTHGIALILIMPVFAALVTPIIPTMDALTLRNVRPHYATVRSAGTGTFLLVSLLGGLAQRWVSVESLLLLIPVCLWLTILPMLFIKDQGITVDRSPGRQLISLPKVLRSVQRKGLLPFFLFAFLHWMSMMQYLIMFSVYMKEMLVRQGFSEPGLWIGVGWTISSLAEILIFIISNRLLRKSKIRVLFISISISSLIRFGIFAMASPVWLILASQIMHAFSFGLFYILGTRLVAAEAPVEMRNSYQTLWASMVMGAGGFIGGLLNSWAAGAFAIEHLYWFSFGLTLLSMIPLVYFLKNHFIDREKMITGE